MKNMFIVIDKKQAVEVALRALKDADICIVNESVDGTYRERKLGVGDQNRGWVIFAKLALEGDWDPDSVTVYVSDPDGKVLIPPFF